jgi:hypothetical protein
VAHNKTTDADLQQAVNAAAEHKHLADAAKSVGVGYGAFRSRVSLARKQGFKPNSAGADPQALAGAERLQLQDRLRELESTLKSERRERLSEDRVREEIFGLANTPIKQPTWALKTSSKGSSPGIPSVLWSDWHWGEVVLPGQIHFKNEFNVTVAKRRLQKLVERTVALCFRHMVNPNYPGIVVNLGGDLVSGDIHDELVETNELTSAQTLIDIVGSLAWALKHIADHFGKVWVIAVAGNHGRMTKKPRAKNRAFTNFDWVIAQLLRSHFVADDRFTWQIPDGPDAWYQVYNRRYLLTHGDQFRGGDGIIGALGPILRGDTKKRARNGNVGLAYDTMLMGHWHQYIPLDRVIVNGSLKGYDEYAMQNNFHFEVPRQALWFTHPEHGITAHWGIQLEKHESTFAGGPMVQLGDMPGLAS